jgi:hypothetical protein
MRPLHSARSLRFLFRQESIKSRESSVCLQPMHTSEAATTEEAEEGVEEEEGARVRAHARKYKTFSRREPIGPDKPLAAAGDDC